MGRGAENRPNRSQVDLHFRSVSTNSDEESGNRPRKSGVFFVDERGVRKKESNVPQPFTLEDLPPGGIAFVSEAAFYFEGSRLYVRPGDVFDNKKLRTVQPKSGGTRTFALMKTRSGELVADLKGHQFERLVTMDSPQDEDGILVTPKVRN